MLQPLSDARKRIAAGTRGSLLARSQTAQVVSQLLRAHPGLNIATEILNSSGDRIQDRPLHEFGGKGLFTKELEIALLEHRIDFAVHSMKDVPVTMPLVDQSGLVFAAIPVREDVRDVLVSLTSRSLADLPRGAKVGTGSLRRKCQLLAHRPDLQVELIRGNIDTRLRKLREGQFDAILLALAGVKRANLLDEILMTPLPADFLLPAAGQGALALQCRAEDLATRQVLQTLDDPQTHACIDAERALVQALNGDCHSPIAAWTRFEGNEIAMDALVGQPDGLPPVTRASTRFAPADRQQAIADLAARLQAL